MTDYYDVYFYRTDDYDNPDDAETDGALYKTPNTVDCLETGNGTFDLIDLINTINKCTNTQVQGVIFRNGEWEKLETYYDRIFRDE